MAIKTTNWKPDTCDCIIEQGIDDSLPQAQQVLFGVSSIFKCPAHSHINNVDDHFNAVNEENPRKNFSLDEILQNAPNNNWFDIDADSGARVFKKGITINWNWTGTAPNRVLTLTFTGVSLTTAQKNTLQTRLNNRFGNGKVILG